MSSDLSTAPLGTADRHREALIEAAARIINDLGPSSLSARHVGTAAGLSTMVVYTCFGSMEALVRTVVERSVERLQRHLLSLEASDDPIADLAKQTAAYLNHARDEPGLYAVLFGGTPLGQYRDAGESGRARNWTLDLVADNWQRAMDVGRIRSAPPSAIALRWWSLAHGYAALEATGEVNVQQGRLRVLVPLLTDLFVGEGDDPELSAASIDRAMGLA